MERIVLTVNLSRRGRSLPLLGFCGMGGAPGLMGGPRASWNFFLWRFFNFWLTPLSAWSPGARGGGAAPDLSDVSHPEGS